MKNDKIIRVPVGTFTARWVACLLTGFISSSGNALAGSYIFAGESNGVDVVIHPTGYTGGSNQNLTVNICIDASSQNAGDLVIPVQNVVNSWNALQETTGNVIANALPSGYDIESVLLHEVGHCIGLGHPNTEAVSGDAGNSTKSTDGADNIYNTHAGADGIYGSADDIRGDDVNLHWFNANNNPFVVDAPVDRYSYWRGLIYLPSGHLYAVNADRTVSALMNYPNTEASMQQVTFWRESQRDLAADDVSSILFAMSGLDRTAGTGDDYTFSLNYNGIVANASTASNCDISVSIDEPSSFAYCSVGGSWISYPNHIRITSGQIHLGTGYNWFFNTESNGGNNPPMASFSYSCSELTCTFDGNASSDDGSIVEYGWDFGDNNSGTGAEIGHTFANAGSYQVRLTVTDDEGASDDEIQTVIVTDFANQAPTASFTVNCSGLTCDFDASGSSDSDGSIVNFTWDFGDGGIGSGVTASHGYAAGGSFNVTLTVVDNDGANDSVSNTAVTTVTPDVANGDYTTSKGSVSGSYVDTLIQDNIYEVITETNSGGKPSVRYDLLDHIWQFNVTGGNHILNVRAYRSVGSGDLDTGFDFAWSNSPTGPWNTVLSVTGTSASDYSADLGGSVSGTIYVRVTDNDRASGNVVYSSIHVDHLFIDGGTPPTDPPGPAAAPSPDNNVTGVNVSTLLSWSAGADTEIHKVYFGSGNPPNYVGDQATATFDPGPLSPDTTYYWRIDEANSVGVTPGPLWSFTTANNAGPTAVEVDSIILSTVSLAKGEKGGRATVVVRDDLGNLIEGAAVSGTFSGSYNEAGSDATDAAGTAVIDTTGTAKKGISFTFCVNTIDYGGLTYEPGTPDCANY
ncbi:MAG: PKD domain-containing protein [Gammaproteobacteria bacterium]